MTIPKEVKNIIQKLKKAGFESYIVGGCVRDFLRGAEPEDWDVTCSAKPEEIQKVFPRSFYENKFLTVTVQIGSKNEKLKEFGEVEVTTFRTEAKYTDKRHPDEIKFAKTLKEDLARRDFTVNAIALELGDLVPKLGTKSPSRVIDYFDGQKDLEAKIIRAVGNPEDRFSEDALRMMRAVRFVATLGEGWQIEEKTSAAIIKNAKCLTMISSERIRDEFLKIIMSERAVRGLELLRKLELLKYIVPELLEGFAVGQNKHHIFSCYEHYSKSLDYAVKNKFNQEVRIASLFHDIGKPRAKRGEGPNSTFYSHEIIGAKMTKEILARLKFPRKDAEKITKLVRYHLFYYNVGEVTESSVRRLVKRAGPDLMDELLQVRQADRIGSGVPKAEPYKLRHLKYVIDKVSQDPISAKMLKVNGEDVMKILEIKPGPKVGQALDILLEEVLDDPKNNTKTFLGKEIKRLGKLSEKELLALAQKAKEEKRGLETKKDEMTKKKYWVT